MLVWLDLETTGLDPIEEAILEVGIVVTDDQCTKLAQASWVMFFAPKWVEDVNPVVQAMHERSGLWNACATAEECKIDEVEQKILEFFADLGLPQKEIPLAGNSIHFDRAFLKFHMPRLEKFFHYRNVDMSTVNELARRWAPDLYNSRPQSEVAHRALSDVENSIATALHYKKMFDAFRVK